MKIPFPGDDENEVFWLGMLVSASYALFWFGVTILLAGLGFWVLT